MNRSTRTAGSILSAALATIGICLLLAGTEKSVIAFDCNQSEWEEPSECVAAHAEPTKDSFVTGASGGCTMSGASCAASGSGCDSSPNWNSARKGECRAYLQESGLSRCADDYSTTLVTLTKVIGNCETANGECGCKYSNAMPETTQNVQVCNCKQEDL